MSKLAEQILTILSGSGEAEAGVLSEGVKRVAKRLERGEFKPAGKQTVDMPSRMAIPGIYDEPGVVLDRAVSRVAPESEAMKRLFGVTRQDLVDIGKTRKGQGTQFSLPAETGGKGSKAAHLVTTRRNANRLVNVLEEAMSNPKYASLVQGMEPWYVMDPAYQRMVQLMGPEKAAQQYKQMNALTGMASAMSPVQAEIQRGTAAHWLANEGRFGDFEKFAGLNPEGRLAAGAPTDIAAVPGHSAHKTAQSPAMRKFVETGAVDMSSPKIPAYIEASGVPETGFQTNMPVGDAHWSRAVGLVDTRGRQIRKGKEVMPGGSVSTPEMEVLGPWWEKKVAGKVDLESVPAQAITWGAFAPTTGVKTKIGAPKLEILADQIMKTSKRLGVTPETARDMVLMGKTHAGKADPRLLAAVGAGGAAAAAGARGEVKDPEQWLKENAKDRRYQATAKQPGQERSVLQRLMELITSPKPEEGRK